MRNIFDYPDGGGQCFYSGDGLGWTSFKVYLGEATLSTTVVGPSGQTTFVQPGLTTTPTYANSTSGYTPILRHADIHRFAQWSFWGIDRWNGWTCSSRVELHRRSRILGNKAKKV